MSSNRRLGNQAEAFVAALLAQENPECLVVPLQQDYGADLAILDVPLAGWCFVEVKSSKLRRQALKCKLSDSEKALQARVGSRYLIVRVLRKPGRPKDTYEVLSRGA